MLEAVATFWIKVPSPEVASGSGQSWTGNETITSVQGWLGPVAFLVFLMSLSGALLKIAFDTRRAGEGARGIGRSLVVTLACGLPVLAITMLCIQAGDEFSPWVLERASGEETSKGFSSIFASAILGPKSAAPAPAGSLLILYIFAIIASLMQCLFMVVRGAAVIVLLSFAQTVAAGTATEEGWMRFKKVVALLVGFVLYKPAAAVIYGVGLKLMSEGATTSDQLINAIYGFTVIVMAVLALPALLKFVAPAAAVGSSSAFSGGAAIAAGVATGAAVVALAGTGGGSAAMAGAGMGGGSGTGRPGGDGVPGAASPSLTSSDGEPSSGGSGQAGAPGGPGDHGEDGATGASGAEHATPPAPPAPAPASSTSGSGGSGGVQLGAATVQNLTSQASQAGEDTSRDAQ
ncbi:MULTISPECIES: hypothetical protein [Pimelobacter]|uniref:hypothetical protein n=1 Tax=Pimelobacter TaxID=2044 RepID=UPI001C03C78B|nr:MULTISPECIES: hypothetical protein [Pimelobacter]UUW93021.1 hypothetical protein M0M43_30475 [Pimelobacter simplex]UUW99054.1 hypothetical protein M0M48_30495 [Pimelobacter simplex]